jgi:uncharacterized Tic20 family protein
MPATDCRHTFDKTLPPTLWRGKSVPVMNNSQWSILLHLSGFAGLLAPGIANWAAPLIIWLIKRTESGELDRVGKEVVNFQLSYTLYSLVLGLIAGILLLILIGALLLPVLFILWVLWMIFMIIGAVKASNGEFYQYPLTIRFIK